MQMIDSVILAVMRSFFIDYTMILEKVIFEWQYADTILLQHLETYVECSFCYAYFVMTSSPLV